MQRLVAVVVGLAFVVLVGALPARAPAAPSAVTFLEPSATVLFGGDMQFDRNVRGTVAERGGDYIFSCIDATLANADLVVANLEGPITTNASLSVSSVPGTPANFVFTFPPATAALLWAHHVGVVNLGNNHILNWGVAGVEATKGYLDQAGVGYFGDPLSQSLLERSVRGVPLAFINYNEFGGSASSTLAHIYEARARGEVPIIYAHWGVEYATTAPQYVHALAHEFVDAGAELVIGSHPHVVEEHETYQGALIYYSLGNFIFDQYFSSAVTHGLLLSVRLTPKGVDRVEEIPIVLGRDNRPCPQSPQ